MNAIRPNPPAAAAPPMRAGLCLFCPVSTIAITKNKRKKNHKRSFLRKPPQTISRYRPVSNCSPWKPGDKALLFWWAEKPRAKRRNSVKNGEIFWMNNKAIIEFGFRRIWRILQISEAVIHRGLRTTPYWNILDSCGLHECLYREMYIKLLLNIDAVHLLLYFSLKFLPSFLLS